jgi:hypothetical protein
MRDIGDRRFDFKEQEKPKDDGGMWWIQGAFLVAIVCLVAAYFLTQRSYKLEYAIVGKPALGELVQRDKTYEQQKLEEHYRYNSYETHSEDDRKGLTAIILGGE